MHFGFTLYLSFWFSQTVFGHGTFLDVLEFATRMGLEHSDVDTTLPFLLNALSTEDIILCKTKVLNSCLVPLNETLDNIVAGVDSVRLMTIDTVNWISYTNSRALGAISSIESDDRMYYKNARAFQHLLVFTENQLEDLGSAVNAFTSMANVILVEKKQVARAKVEISSMFWLVLKIGDARVQRALDEENKGLTALMQRLNEVLSSLCLIEAPLKLLRDNLADVEDLYKVMMQTGYDVSALEYFQRRLDVVVNSWAEESNGNHTTIKALSSCVGVITVPLRGVIVTPEGQSLPGQSFYSEYALKAHLAYMRKAERALKQRDNSPIPDFAPLFTAKPLSESLGISVTPQTTASVSHPLPPNLTARVNDVHFSGPEQRGIDIDKTRTSQTPQSMHQPLNLKYEWVRPETINRQLESLEANPLRYWNPAKVNFQEGLSESHFIDYPSLASLVSESSVNSLLLGHLEWLRNSRVTLEQNRDAARLSSRFSCKHTVITHLTGAEAATRTKLTEEWIMRQNTLIQERVLSTTAISEDPLYISYATYQRSHWSSSFERCV
ncbi:hypothetical protein C8J55DRAFT_556321 [Lentinula edodes]|uniref:Uncharacterized protein n=1 Tax=Lentinula lateritia TaxID=40482 RepID=A0A9W9AWE8_9AGAR|nr:hypothetical protein C8J55DRAFT_556321 [Lentinula edodes]